MKKPAIFVAFLITPFVVSGCTSMPDDYPSLAIRDIERVGTTMSAPASQNIILPQPGPDTVSKLSQLTKLAENAHTSFLESALSVRQTIDGATGAASGSEPWSIAQIALAELQATRSDAVIALADIDRIYVAASTAGEALGQISDAQQKVEQFVAIENSVISKLAKKLD